MAWIIAAVIDGLALLALLVAKLTGYIAWSWWIVAAPIWAPVLLAAVAALIFFVGIAKDEASGGNPFQ